MEHKDFFFQQNVPQHRLLKTVLILESAPYRLNTGFPAVLIENSNEMLVEDIIKESNIPCTETICDSL